MPAYAVEEAEGDLLVRSFLATTRRTAERRIGFYAGKGVDTQVAREALAGLLAPGLKAKEIQTAAKAVDTALDKCQKRYKER